MLDWFGGGDCVLELPNVLVLLLLDFRLEPRKVLKLIDIGSAGNSLILGVYRKLGGEEYWRVGRLMRQPQPNVKE